HPHGRQKFHQTLPGGRIFQIFDDHRLHAACPDHRQRIARRAAFRVVINSDGHWAPPVSFAGLRLMPRSYQPWERLTIHTTESITGTSTRTPTTVASAAPELNPKRLMAAATESSKKLDAPISAEGPATQCRSPDMRLRM